jgi:hypothetical protein
MNRSQIIKLIEEKISKTKNKKDREKLKELEKAVEEGKIQKAKRFAKELSTDLGKGLFEAIIIGAGSSV